MNIACLGTLARKQVRSSWLSGYSYRKSFTYSRPSGAVSDYQVKILVGESSGATGEDVDCGGHCLATFADLRFTKSDGTTELDYWIESISGTTPNQIATVWVELDSVGTDATTFYMYYGKADASAGSDGDSTFLFFDDFAGASLDNDKWTTVQGDVGVADGVLTLTGTSGTRGLIEGKTGITQGAEIATRAKSGANGIFEGNHFLTLRQTGDWNNRGLDISGNIDDANRLLFDSYASGFNTRTTNIPATATSYAVYAGRWTSGKAVLLRDGTTLATHTTHVSAGTQYPVFYEARYSSYTATIDWIYIRKYEETEPALGSWGSEES